MFVTTKDNLVIFTTSEDIVIKIIDKHDRADGTWRIIGDGPERLLGQSGLLVRHGVATAKGTGAEVCKSVDDELLATGRSIPDALRKLAKVTGCRVVYLDETRANKVLGIYEQTPAQPAAKPTLTTSGAGTLAAPQAGKARRGDLVVIRSLMPVAVNGAPVAAATGEDRYDETRYQLATVTSVSRAGDVKAYQDIYHVHGAPIPVNDLVRFEIAVILSGKAAVEDLSATIISKRRAFDAGFVAPYVSARELMADLTAWQADYRHAGTFAPVRRWCDREQLAEIERQRCEHTVSEVGCERFYCNGVPPQTIPLDRFEHAIPESVNDDTNYGEVSIGRALAFASWDAFGRDGDAMPMYACSRRYDVKWVRLVESFTWTIPGHSVRAVRYESSTATCRETLPHFAVYVDDVLIAAGIEGWHGRRRIDELACVIATHIGRYLESVVSQPVGVTPATVCEPVNVPVSSDTNAKESVMSRIAFTVDQSEVSAALAFARQAIPTRAGVPVMAGVLIVAGDTVTMTGFDYDTSAVAALITARTVRPGSVLVEAKSLADLVKGIDKGMVEFAADDQGKLGVTQGTWSAELATMPVEDYPTVPCVTDTFGSINLASLAGMAKRMATVAGRDDTLPMLQCVKVEFGKSVLSMDATDRFRVASADLDGLTVNDGDQPAPWLISAAPFAAALAAFATHAGAKGKQTAAVTFGHAGDFTAAITYGPYLWTRREYSEGTSFPPIRALFPKACPVTAQAAVKDLSATVRRVTSGLAKGKDKGTHPVLTVAWDKAAGTLRLSAGASDQTMVGQTIPGAIDGASELITAFNSSFLLDGLTVLDSKTAFIGFTDPTRPAVLTGSESGGFRYLLMPIRNGSNSATYTTSTKEGSATMPTQKTTTTATRKAKADTKKAAVTPTPEAAPVESTSEAGRKAELTAAVVASLPAPAIVIIEDLEQRAQHAFEAMNAGDHNGAQEWIATGEKVNSGYLVGGRHSWADVRAAIETHRANSEAAAIEAAPVAEPTPTVVPAVTPVEPTPQAAPEPGDDDVQRLTVALLERTGFGYNQVAEVREILANASNAKGVTGVGWTIGVIKGEGFDVLNTGKVTSAQYGVIREVVRFFGGHWSKQHKGHAFPVSKPRYDNSYTRDYRTHFEAWLGTAAVIPQPAASEAASVAEPTPATVPAVTPVEPTAEPVAPVALVTVEQPLTLASLDAATLDAATARALIAAGEAALARLTGPTGEAADGDTPEVTVSADGGTVLMDGAPVWSEGGPDFSPAELAALSGRTVVMTAPVGQATATVAATLLSYRLAKWSADTSLLKGSNECPGYMATLKVLGRKLTDQGAKLIKSDDDRQAFTVSTDTADQGAIDAIVRATVALA